MKKLLLSLFVGFVGIISFCSSFSYFNNDKGTVSVARSTNNVVVYSGYLYDRYVWCFTPDNSSVSCSFKRMSDGYTVSNITSSKEYCAFNNHIEGNVLFNVICSNTSTTNHNIIYYNMNLEGYLNSYLNNNCPTCPTCPSCGECTGYNLNLVYSGIMTDTYSINSDINLNIGQNISAYTLSFPSISLSSTCQGFPECPDGDFSGFSKFYVRHGESTWSQLTGTENYYVYLPEYLGYNYEYSNGTDLDFTVGVGVDTGFINNISAIQNSKPSQEDLNKLVSEVLPLFIPGLAVILLLYFIFRFIKKIF